MTGTHLCALSRLGAPRRVLVVAAHPDDETIGVGITLSELVTSGADVTIVHVTDGAPRDAALRPRLREHSREKAAAIRRAEVERALRAGGIDPPRVLAASLGVTDQEAALSMAALARSLAALLLLADVVITHPYEGGHPDHDAVAFAVHAAQALVARDGTAPPIAEMTSYHSERGVLATGRFLPAEEHRCVREGILSAEQRARKRSMLDAFVSQRTVLEPFGTDAEPLRCAPRYDFRRPANEGLAHYERLPFGWTTARFVELAREALRELALDHFDGS